MPRFILAVDPGKITGVALLRKDEDAVDPVLQDTWELEQVEFGPTLREVIWNPVVRNNLEVVCERFVINAQTVRNSQAPYSLEVIGMLKLLLIDLGRSPEDIYFQAPANAMAMFDNKKLKKLEYWHKGGAGHALDAIRHALLRAVNTGWKPVKLLED